MPAPLHDAHATASLLEFPALVAAVRQAALDRDEGRIACPERSVVPMSDGAVLMSMPAVAADVAIHKLITVAPSNREHGMPTIQGTVTVFEPRTGNVLMGLDGPTVTGTAASASHAFATISDKTDGTLL